MINRIRKQRKFTYNRVAKTILCGSILAVNTAYAQAPTGSEATPPERRAVLEEVVVSAQRRDQSLQQVPIAMTAVTQDMSQQFGLRDVQDIALIAPSVDATASPGYLKIYMRGLGQAFVTPGLESPVAMYLDGAYLQRMAGFNSLLDLVDIDRVEVLRGPQGTLYGRNATGGAMLLHTADPTDYFEGRVAAEVGRFGHRQVEGMVNIPLTETLSARFAGRTVKDDGYIKNVATGRYLHAEDSYTVRGKLGWRPNEMADIVLSVESQESKPLKAVNQLSYGAPICYVCQTSGHEARSDFYEANQNARPRWDISLLRVNLNATFSLENYEITSSTGFLKDDSEQGNDTDFTPVDVFNYEVPEVSGETFTQELTLSSQYAGPLNFTAGLGYLKDKANMEFLLTGSAYSGFPTFPGNTNRVETESMSVFLEGIYDVTENVTVTLGGRYTRDERTLDAANNAGFQAFGLPATFSLDDKYDAFTPRFVVSWSNNNTNIYYSYTQGFKAGGFGAPATSPVGAVDPEEVESHEVGIKHQAFDNRLTANLAVFYYEATDYHSQVIDVDSGGTFIQNAGGVDGKGVELEISLIPTDGLSLTASASYLDVEYSDYDAASAVCLDPSGTGNPFFPGSVLVACALDLSGKRVPHAPKFSGSLAASYDFSIGDWDANLSGLVHTRSSYDFYPAAGGDLNHDKQSYTVVNFSGYVSPPGSGVEIGFYLDNAFDEKYVIDAATYETWGAAYVAAKPRTYGMRVAYEF